jgi:hypothetical protein
MPVSSLRLLRLAAVTAMAVPAITSMPAIAQVNADSTTQQAYCRLAEQVMRTGNPAPHMEWALSSIGTCGPVTYGAATAAAVQRLRAVHDTSALAEVWMPTHFLLDEKLFNAALHISGDRSASVEARVFAFLGLLRMALAGTGRDVRYGNMIGGFVEVLPGLLGVRGGCAEEVVTDDYRRVGTPLPPDFKDQIRSVATRVRDDTSEPVDARTAAACALTGVRKE